MNTQKLAKALKKELTRNPKKTIALGLVTVVALWFWAPLAWKWSGKGKSKAKPAAVASAPAHPAAATPTNKVAEVPTDQVAKPAETKLHWSELLERMSRDERMQSATLRREARDPFMVTAVESELTPAAPEQTAGVVAPAVVRADASPADMGLVLQGTLVSSNRARAVISGRTFGIGEKVLAKAANADPKASEPLEFELSVIEPSRVVLIRKDKSYELKLIRATLAEGDQLSFGGSR